ncbi:MAG: lysophospholipid acyltransferase family protein [Alphaproteobacteria bacterium]
MLSWKRLGSQRWVQVAAGTLAAEYMRFVYATTRVTIDPPDGYARFDAHLPVIIAMWHGQHFMSAFAKRPGDRGKVLISRHRDAEINAIAAKRLGIETIRGSGDIGASFIRKGGLGAFREMLDTLEAGDSVALTADVPKIARVAGRGIVMLARESGRPIFPIALATSRRYVLDNWDKTTINLPFSRGGAVCGEPVWVPADTDNGALEQYRRQVEDNLNAATARAYAIADNRRGGAGRG